MPRTRRQRLKGGRSNRKNNTLLVHHRTLHNLVTQILTEPRSSNVATFDVAYLDTVMYITRTKCSIVTREPSVPSRPLQLLPHTSKSNRLDNLILLNTILAAFSAEATPLHTTKR